MTDEILQKLIQYLDSTKDFLLEQTPQVIQELVVLGIIRNGIYSLSIACVTYVLFYVGKFCYNQANIAPKNSWETPEVWYIPAVACLFLAGFSFFTSITYIVTFLAAIFAPKAYLLEMLIRK
jgi:hypothetical protein